MCKSFRKVLANLHRDDRGLGTVEAVMLLGVGCIVLYAISNIVGVGSGAGSDTNTFTGGLVTMAKSYIFNINGGGGK